MKDLDIFLESLENPCWGGYEMVGMKKKNGKSVPNCVPASEEMESVIHEGDYTCYEDITEAEYQGRKVKLNKPMRGDVKKFKVYVSDGKNEDGSIKVKKVNFGDPDMKIKKSNPERRRSFRARHKCDEKKDKTTAGYWSCRKW
jgi:hypothetical protein